MVDHRLPGKVLGRHRHRVIHFTIPKQPIHLSHLPAPIIQLHFCEMLQLEAFLNCEEGSEK